MFRRVVILVEFVDIPGDQIHVFASLEFIAADEEEMSGKITGE